MKVKQTARKSSGGKPPYSRDKSSSTSTKVSKTEIPDAATFKKEAQDIVLTLSGEEGGEGFGSITAKVAEFTTG